MLAVFQPRAFQPASQSLIPFCTYWLSVCTITSHGPKEKTKGGLAAEVTASAFFYDFATVGLSDEQMKDCLASKGEWRAVARDSDTFRKAQLEHMNKRHHRQYDDLTKALKAAE